MHLSFSRRSFGVGGDCNRMEPLIVCKNVRRSSKRDGPDGGIGQCTSVRKHFEVPRNACVHEIVISNNLPMEVSGEFKNLCICCTIRAPCSTYNCLKVLHRHEMEHI